MLKSKANAHKKITVIKKPQKMPNLHRSKIPRKKEKYHSICRIRNSPLTLSQNIIE